LLDVEASGHRRAPLLVVGAPARRGGIGLR
jgi:hypothetical protein